MAIFDKFQQIAETRRAIAESGVRSINVVMEQVISPTEAIINGRRTILAGTNRVKTYEEVKSNRITVTGTDSLKMLLDRFPENEDIFWIGERWLKNCWHGFYGNLSLPAAETINEIRNYCLQKNLVLNISN